MQQARCVQGAEFIYQGSVSLLNICSTSTCFAHRVGAEFIYQGVRGVYSVSLLVMIKFHGPRAD